MHNPGGRNEVATWFGHDMSRSLLVAEVAQTHDGSLGCAHAFVDGAADAGADAVKFQTHIAAAESTPAEPWRVKFSRQDDTRYDYWRRMEFTEAQWGGLRDHAEERGIAFLSTPFSVAAVELLDRVGMAAWKAASGEVGNLELLSAMAARGPVLLSSGMSTLAELDAAIAHIRSFRADVAVMQCTTAYPTEPHQVGLNLLGEFRSRWSAPVGLSDHSGTIFPALAAATLGAEVIEVHLTLSRRMFGPDVVASVTVEELATIRRGLEFIDTARANPADKNLNANASEPLKALFGRSLVAARDLPVGHRIEPSDIVAKKPGSGIPPTHRDRVVGRVVHRAVRADQLIAYEDLEESQ